MHWRLTAGVTQDLGLHVRFAAAMIGHSLPEWRDVQGQELGNIGVD